MDFLAKLDVLLKERDIKNKAQLAELSGIPYTTIDGFYKKGTENIRRSTLLRLSKFFNVSLDYLANDDILDRNFGKTSNFSVTYEEMNHIKKYRALDQRGKDAVDATLDREYEYVTAPPKIQMVARGEGKARELTGKHAEAANKVLKELFKDKNKTDK